MEDAPVVTKPTKAGFFSSFTEIHFAIIYMVIAIIGVFVATRYDVSYINIASSSINGVALWLFSMIGLAITLNGLKCNVWHQVIEEGNTGLGTMIGLFGVALAIVIHG